MQEVIYQLSNIGANVSYFLPFIFFLRSKNLSKRLPFKCPLFILLTAQIAYVSIGVFFLHFIHNGYPIYHISVFVLTILTIYFFRDFSASIRFVSNIFLIISTVVFTLETVVFYRIWENNLFMTLLSNLEISILSFMAIYVNFNNFEIEKKERDFNNFYISTGFFIFNCSSFFFSLFEGIIRSKNELFMTIFPVFMLLIIIQNLLTCVGIWELRKSLY
jgi:hypothetical protein